MTGAWLDELLPQAMLSPRSRILWLPFFLLFPLAYLGGVLLELAEERSARVEGAFDRAMSIRAAQQFAESKGLSVGSWNHYVIVETHDDLLSYYTNAQRPDLAAASLLTPSREITVLLRSPDGNNEFRAYLSLTGQIAGFDMGKFSAEQNANVTVGAVTINSTKDKSAPKGSAASKAANLDAEPIARRFLTENATLNSFLKLGRPAGVEPNSDDSARTEVSWDAIPPAEKELNFHIVVSVRDSRVVAQRITAKLDESYAKSALPKKAKFPIVLNSIYSLFLTCSVLYAIFRYAKRTFQKEVSHVRTLVVAAIFCASYTIYVYSLAVDQVAVRISAQKFAEITLPIYGLAVFGFAVMGLLVGIAYGSGEGEVREA